jgi:hypothetical protein
MNSINGLIIIFVCISNERFLKFQNCGLSHNFHSDILFCRPKNSFEIQFDTYAIPIDLHQKQW